MFIKLIKLYICPNIKTNEMKRATQLKIGLAIAAYFILRTLINI